MALQAWMLIRQYILGEGSYRRHKYSFDTIAALRECLIRYLSTDSSIILIKQK
jgi:hypothetical protein